MIISYALILPTLQHIYYITSCLIYLTQTYSIRVLSNLTTSGRIGKFYQAENLFTIQRAVPLITL